MLNGLCKKKRKSSHSEKYQGKKLAEKLVHSHAWTTVLLEKLQGLKLHKPHIHSETKSRISIIPLDKSTANQIDSANDTAC